MDPEVEEFGRQFQLFMQRMNEIAWAGQASPLRELLDEHLGVDSSSVPVVSESFAPYDHVNVQVALTAYLEDGRSHGLLGLLGQQRHYSSLSDLLDVAHQLGIRVGPPDLVNLPIGPGETLACVQYGLYLVTDGDARFAVLLRGAEEQHGQALVTIEVLADNRALALAFLAGIRRLIVELNVFRGQVLSFGDSQMGHMAIGPMVFHERPAIERAQLVLSPGVLESIEREVLGIAEHQERLRRGGQHVKRGLLLYGPPGTGKTLTVRYLVSRVEQATVLVLTGGGLHMVRPACALARMLQPSVVVLEDVDLVAEERTMYSGYGGNPLLFDVLNEMDGMAEDADVTFLLTTNRADVLEPALAARPGRVDLAVEIHLPDEDSRLRLIRLYGSGLQLHLHDPASIVGRTAGVTASFVKELMRKAALLAAEGSRGDIEVGDAHVHAALDELLAERSALTRTLLGGGGSEGSGAASSAATAWLS